MEDRLLAQRILDERRRGPSLAIPLEIGENDGKNAGRRRLDCACPHPAKCIIQILDVEDRVSQPRKAGQCDGADNTRHEVLDGPRAGCPPYGC